MKYSFKELRESTETHYRAPENSLYYTAKVAELTYTVEGSWGSLIGPVTIDAEKRLDNLSDGPYKYIGSYWKNNDLVLTFEGRRDYA